MSRLILWKHFIAVFCVFLLLGGGGVQAAHNETLLQKMQRETVYPVPAVKAPPVSDAPSLPAPVVLDHVKERFSPLPSESENLSDDTRPARPLDWPPEHYMQRAPVVEAQEMEQGLKRSTTFVASGVAEKTQDEAGKDGASEGAMFLEKQVASPDAGVQSGYILGPGDKMKITVFGEEALSGNYTVNDAGQISYPLVGEVTVRNLNVLQVKSELTRLLREGYLRDPNIAIEVLEFRPFYITGEVRAPGSYGYVSDMSIMNAVILAGGFTFRAEQDEVEILRTTASGTTMLKDVKTEEKVVPGDIILVKERFF